MKLRTQKTITFLLLLSFLFADVSESNPLTGITEAITGFLNKLNPLKNPPFLSKLPTKPDGNLDLNKWKKYAKKAKEYADDLKDRIEAAENLLNSSLLQPNYPEPEERSVQITDLQSEISKIQANFNLAVTGKLDPNTMKILSKPRCDFPDKINGTRTFTKVFKKQISLKPWWRINEKKKNLTYAFGNNVPVQVKSLFQYVFKRWSNALALKFTETKVIKDSDILIAFVKTDGKGGMVGRWDCIVGKR